MQQREGFSARTLALSTAAAELGRVILRAGQSGSVRAALLGNVLATAALVLLAVFVSWNAARLRRPGFVGNCCCAAFLLWYLWELVRTAAMIQQVCWEQFSSMAFFGLLPLLLWAGWSLGCELYDRMAAVLGAFVVLGSLFCLLGLALLFGAPQGYPGYELLRAWSFGGISRFDAAFLLLWLAAAVFRLCFLVRTARLLCERLAGRPSGTAGAEAAR